ncbi:chemotaxis protein CheA [Desulforhabdus amnigena]|jgi:two-component system chemotaxis sensor kinase CheA|uniref:Chemotaxis protein CheA n=1 Tax=Desulforhabdus amnigena TaxID=40218 RepID=A0A9W6D2T0_9BACT|nr:chemotaxis protein CheA [Desulforhabdus amnigena]NLJ27642.1 chemotaxis protein CheA [Deltaproteobacteria bacterium]GLI33548.1 chemotaxis protein CheA [Desulforhabdus amnigena]
MKSEDTVLSLDEIRELLTNGVIAASDDLMGMGECLNLLEHAEQACDLSESSRRKILKLKEIINRLILDESRDPESDWGTVQNLLNGLFSSTSDEDSPMDFDLDDLGNLDRCREEMILEGDAPSSETAETYDPELLKDFIEEAKEHLASIEINMLSLEANPEDEEAINAVFRPFHSIKGVAGFLNLGEIHHLSHEVENLLDAARAGTIVVTENMIDIVLNAVDILKVLLQELEKSSVQGTGIGSLSQLVEPFLEKVRSLQSPDVQEQKPATKKLGTILVEKGLVDEKVIQEAVKASKSKGTKLGEELVCMGAVDPRDVSEALGEQRKINENTASVRIDTQKLDNLVDMVGELVIAQSMVLQNPDLQNIKDQKLQKDIAQLGRITAELQRISLSMRMVPIKSTFQKMIRLVRDVSKKAGKNVVLEMKGEETEIDRNMVEEIYEPLVHMIRNSIDHGIESPEERTEADKPAQGTVFLTAEQKGGNILINIQDDGRGLDVKRIHARAVERGIIGANEPLEEREVYDLIFHPGFSTKDQVTEVSGRGVGMDVVKKSVERLRGKIEISSSKGNGTRFNLKLPLTMAIIDGMIVRVGEERFVVPTIALKESLRPAREAYLTVQGKGELIKVREQLMPLIRLHEIFEVEPRYRNPWEGLLLVVNEDNRSYCLQADEIIGRQEVVIKSLGTTLRHLGGISGGAILGDGKVALIVDVKGIVSLYEDKLR